jgi:hypothetical protein
MFILQMAQVPRFFSCPNRLKLWGRPPCSTMYLPVWINMPPEPQVWSQNRGGYILLFVRPRKKLDGRTTLHVHRPRRLRLAQERPADQFRVEIAKTFFRQAKATSG